jgi:hypothetical protein
MDNFTDDQTNAAEEQAGTHDQPRSARPDDPQRHLADSGQPPADPLRQPPSPSAASERLAEHVARTSPEWRRLYEAVSAALRRDRAGLSD